MIGLEATLKGLFLLILAVAGNFISETLGCQTQKFLSENMFTKHIISIFLLYFSIGFANNDSPEHPFTIMQTAACIYTLFLLFTKMNLAFTAIVFALLGASYVNYTFIKYYKFQKNVDVELIKQLEDIQQKVTKLMAGLILIGFSLYFRKQYTSYYKNWSTSKFLFGVAKCKSI